MQVEVYVKTSETENTKESSHYRGEAKISVKDSAPPLSGNFTFHLSDPGTDKQQFIVRKDDKILLNLKGDVRQNPEAHFSSNTDVLLYVMLVPGLHNTLQQIYAERGGSQGAAEQAANLFGQLGMSFEIVAEHTRTHEVTEPEQESCVVELCG